MTDVLLILALLLLLGFLCQWVAWRIRLPAILFLLLAGITIGPGLGWIDPDALLGDLLFPVVSLGVAVILFEGSLTLRLDETRGIQKVIYRLLTVGVLVTWLGLAAAAYFIAGLSWELSLLFGALVSVTGPTVVVPLLRSVRPTSRIANVLRWEGILVDPIGAMLAVLVFEIIISGRQAEPFLAFGKLVLIGGSIGAVGAWLLAFVLRRHWIPEYLQNLAALSWVLTVFAVSGHLAHESGLLAVTVMGVVLANMEDLHVEDILDFKEHLTVLLISLLFLLLGARLDMALLTEWLTVGLILLLIAKFVVRPLAVFLSGRGGSLETREKLLLSWIAPRGIVAAAVAAFFSLRLVEEGVPQAEALVPLVFMIIIGTVIIDGFTSKALAGLLGLSAGGRHGVLIAGANRVGLGLARALQKMDVKVIVADTEWESIRNARMQGFDTYYGSLLSEHADRHLDLTEITYLFAVTRNPELNTLICSRYKPEFGMRRTLLMLQSKDREQQRNQRNLASALRTPVLFGEHVSWSQLATILAKGAEPRITQLTPDFDLAAYREEHGPDAVIMFAVSPEGRLRVFNSLENVELAEGWRVCALIQGGRPEPAGNEGEVAPAT